LVSATVSLVLDGVVRSGIGGRRHGDPVRICLRNDGAPRTSAGVVLGDMGGFGRSEDARIASPGCCLRARRHHCAKPDIKMGAARSGRDRGCDGCVRRSRMVCRVLFHLNGICPAPQRAGESARMYPTGRAGRGWPQSTSGMPWGPGELASGTNSRRFEFRGGSLRAFRLKCRP